MKKISFLLLVILLLPLISSPALSFSADAPRRGSEEPELRDSYDVIVAGAGTGGVAAALQAARLGASVLLLEESDWIGGQMAAAGVTSMDEGYPPRSRVRARGIYAEFCLRAEAYYRAIGKSTDTSAVTEDHFAIEPHKARQFLYDMISDTYGCITPLNKPAILDVLLRVRVMQVRKSGNQVTGVVIERTVDGKPRQISLSCAILIDATEYGDVIPLTGAAYRIGNLTSGQLGQLKNDAHSVPPLQDNTWTAVIKQYPEGAPDELILKVPPPGYDESQLSSFLSNDADPTPRYPWNWTRLLKYRGMPDSSNPLRVQNGNGLLVTRTHINFLPNDHPFNVLDVELPERREEAEYQARLKTLRVIYHFQHSMGIKDWSVANDVGYDSLYNLEQVEALIEKHPELEPFRPVLNHFPPIPYVRESRRIIGGYSLKAKDLRRVKPYSPQHFQTAVAVGDYPVDVHAGPEQKDFLDPGLDEPDDFPSRWIAWGYGPFQIPFECFIPQDIDGFLPAEKNLSQSRLANGATRLQPSTMLTGQAAGAIAGAAVQLGVQPRDVEPLIVQEILLEAGSDLTIRYYDDIIHGSELWKAIQLTDVYQILDYAPPRFSPQQQVSQEEIDQAKERLRKLQLFQKHGAKFDESQLDFQAKTREELVRKAAEIIRSAVVNPFGIHEHSAQ
ncbi:MAG: FAD-dependent oxidoreductase [bacterium]|jgi:hypothetical protein